MNDPGSHGVHVCDLPHGTTRQPLLHLNLVNVATVTMHRYPSQLLRPLCFVAFLVRFVRLCGSPCRATDPK